MLTGLFAEEPATLRLDVYLNDAMMPVDVHSIITNTSDKPVTVPTSTYGGNPSSSWTGEGNAGFTFSIGFDLPVAGNLPLVPSPQRFFPVALMPGESTELPIVEIKVTKGKSVRVRFYVDEAYAKRFGWWSGKLSKEVVAGDGPNPYVIPVTSNNADVPAKKPSSSNSLLPTSAVTK